MKKNVSPCKREFLFLFFAFISLLSAKAQVNENFDGSTHSFVVSGGASVTTVQPCSGTKSILFTATGQIAQSPAVTDPTSLSFTTKRSSNTTAHSMTVQISAAGSASGWTTIGTLTLADFAATCATYPSINLSSYTGVRYIRFVDARPSGTAQRAVDDVVISATAAAACTTPSAASTVTATATANTTASGTFTSSSADGYLVVSSATATSPTPLDGTTYAANANVPGGGTAVSSVTTGVFSVTGLTACNAYYYHIFAFNNTACAGGPKYAAAASSIAVGQPCANSDIVSVASSEAITISSIANTPAPLTSASGVSVWKFDVRDGGASLNDVDALPTIVQQLKITVIGSADVADIQAIALFKGSTKLAELSAPITSPMTFGTVGSTLLTVADDTKETIEVRLTLKNPLSSATPDGDLYLFSIANTNVTFSAAGSGKTAFAAAQSDAAKNKVEVLATKLVFTQQPVTTATNLGMATVKVSATDANGNLDKDFTGTISITSTGTMTGSPRTATAVAGVASIPNIVHTVAGTNYTLTASSTPLSPATSTLFDIFQQTNLKTGDMVIVGYDTYVASGGVDKISVLTLVDLLPNSTFTIANVVYEIGAAANERTDRWYVGNGNADANNVAYVSLKTTAAIAKGSIICVKLSGSLNTLPSPSSDISVNGAVNTNFTVSGTANVNVNSSGSGDAIWLMQGNFTPSSTTDLNSYYYSTFTGTLLGAVQFNSYACVPSTFYKFNEAVPATDCSLGVNTTNRVSRIHPDVECIATGFTPLSGFWLQYKSTASHSGTQHAILSNIADFATNWSTGVTSGATGDPDNITTCSSNFTVTQGAIAGRWIGQAGAGSFNKRDWFYCGNWDNFTVPDETTDVIIPSTAADGIDPFTPAEINKTASPYAAKYNNVAVCRNLTVNSPSFEVRDTASVNDTLKVFGNVVIGASATINLSKAGSTSGGILKVYGNWADNNSADGLNDAGGTVIFAGNATQTLSDASDNERFYTLIIDKPTSSLLQLNNHISVSELLHFGTGGILDAGSKTVHLTKNSASALDGYSDSGFNDKYVRGKLRRNVVTGINYDFPIGDDTHYNQVVSLNFNGLNGATYADGIYTNVGSLASGGTDEITGCNLDGDGNDKAKYTQMTGVWSMSSDVTTGLDYSISLFPGGTNPFNAAAPSNIKHDGAYILTCNGNAAHDAPLSTSNTTALGLTHFSPFQIGSGITVLPVKLLSLTAVAQQNSVVLQWKTASELNNDYFEVLHSSDGINFAKIGTVKGNGTTNLQQSYSFLHKNAGEGTHFYRLRQVDYDQKSELTRIISVIIGRYNQTTLVVNGNPIRDIATLNIDAVEAGDAVLEMLASDGKLLHTQKITLNDGLNTLPLDASNLASGIYILRLKTSESNANITRFVKE